MLNYIEYAALKEKNTSSLALGWKAWKASDVTAGDFAKGAFQNLVSGVLGMGDLVLANQNPLMGRNQATIAASLTNSALGGDGDASNIFDKCGTLNCTSSRETGGFGTVVATSFIPGRWLGIADDAGRAAGGVVGAADDVGRGAPLEALPGPTRIVVPPVRVPAPGQLQQEVADLFSKTNNRSGITIGNKSYLNDASNTGGAKIFDGVSEKDVFTYFGQLTGQELPAARALPGKGIVYTIVTPQGNFTLRNFSTSGAQSGAKWTIDVPAKLIGRTGKPPELKFR